MIWKDIAAKIIGVEPNDEMRDIAEKNDESGNITFLKGVSSDTTLPCRQ